MATRTDNYTVENARRRIFAQLTGQLEAALKEPSFGWFATDLQGDKLDVGQQNIQANVGANILKELELLENARMDHDLLNLLIRLPRP